MASKLNNTRKQPAYLMAYFGFLLLSVSGLILQGGLGVLAWLGASTAAFVGLWCLIRHSYRCHAKDLSKLQTKSMFERRKTKA